jgi:predicted ArsR family transcriptional regulator
MRKQSRRKGRPGESLLRTTKGQILVMLCRERLTVAECADRLGISNNAARAQLERLERDGLVAKAGSRPGVRKPHAEYELTAEALKLFPRAYEPVLVQVVNVLSDRLRPGAARALLLDAGRQLLQRKIGALRGRRPRQRLAELMEKLNGWGLGIDVTEQPGKTVVRSCSCPIASVVTNRPELCGLFATALGELLGAEVFETCERGESARCRFELVGLGG